jgi:hypothetical protein
LLIALLQLNREAAKALCPLGDHQVGRSQLGNKLRDAWHFLMGGTFQGRAGLYNVINWRVLVNRQHHAPR